MGEGQFFLHCHKKCQLFHSGNKRPFKICPKRVSNYQSQLVEAEKLFKKVTFLPDSPVVAAVAEFVHYAGVVLSLFVLVFLRLSSFFFFLRQNQIVGLPSILVYPKSHIENTLPGSVKLVKFKSYKRKQRRYAWAYPAHGEFMFRNQRGNTKE